MKKKRIAFAIPIFLVCLGFVLPAQSARDNTRIKAVSAKEAADIIEKHKGDSDFAILDIRTPGEFRKSRCIQ